VSSIAAAEPAMEPRARLSVGRAFLHPAFDLLVIGGGLSLLVVAVLRLEGPTVVSALMLGALPAIVLFVNGAHFAASTVRLYTKAGSFQDLPFLTMVLPLVTILVLSLSVWRADVVGRHLVALYLTWSPYHYARQAYGIGVMYCYRSKCILTAGEKRLLLLTALAPFAYAFFDASGAGIEWFVPATVFLNHPSVYSLRGALVLGLGFATFAMPILLFGFLALRGKTLPLLTLAILVSNGVWWVTLSYMDAFIWATIFHGLQYLAITLVFHVRERTAQPGNQRGVLFHAGVFYLWCLLLGYLLFQVWPYAYRAAGFGWAESLLLTTAAINIHHFIVDAYIWRIRKDSNYRVVVGVPAPA
jgi:hypothetical protein